MKYVDMVPVPNAGEMRRKTLGEKYRVVQERSHS